MSSSFTWTSAEVAKLGSRGTVYILAQENLCLDLAENSDEYVHHSHGTSVLNEV